MSFRTAVAWACLHLMAVVIALFCGCASPPSNVDTDIVSPYEDGAEENNSDIEDDVPDEVLTSIRKRNRKVEDDPSWLNEAVKQLMLKYLRKIPPHEYVHYAQYVDSGRVYVIVHPAYYVFFHDYHGSTDPYITDNVVERFISEPTSDSMMRVLQHQEKEMRDFLEYASTEKKLVILILPGQYKKYKRYAFKGKADEYARYINEVTNDSDSVVYLYSKRPNTGRLYTKDLKRLIDFLEDVGAKEVLVGGGYFERCLEAFYKKLLRYTDMELYLVPELVQISPRDMNFFLARRFLNDNGLMDMGEFTRYIAGKLDEKGGQRVSGLMSLGSVVR